MNRYKKGANYERDIVNQARANGHLAFRSAGSHSPIDVIIIDNINFKIYLIQCKTGTLSKSEEKKVNEQISSLNGVYEVTAELKHKP